MKRLFTSTTPCALFVVLCLFYNTNVYAQEKPTPSDTITPYLSFGVKECFFLLKADTSFVVLDVRTNWEYKNSYGRLTRAMFIPFDELESRIQELQSFRSRPIMVYCHSGMRSRRACDLLSRVGFLAYNMEGGIKSWMYAGLPVVKLSQAVVKK